MSSGEKWDDQGRFSRVSLLLGREVLDFLGKRHVTICGLGAVGSYVLEGLVRMGIGHFRIVDFDVVRPSNFNRQLLALTAHLGKKKVEVAADRVREINPFCRVEKRDLFIDERTLPSILDEQTDIVVDAIDSLGPKVMLLSECWKRNLPVVSSMGAAGRRDPSKIVVEDLFKTRNCPLAQQIRKRLRKTGITSGIRCVYSSEMPGKEYIGLEEESVPGELERGRKRKPLGSLSYITGIFGLMIVSEVVRMLLESKDAGALKK
jgi:tRNA A37 threonylcarbamoyladenosine dehydratase